jgi:hypothetical protein
MMQNITYHGPDYDFKKIKNFLGITINNINYVPSRYIHCAMFMAGQRTCKRSPCLDITCIDGGYIVAVIKNDM